MQISQRVQQVFGKNITLDQQLLKFSWERKRILSKEKQRKADVEVQKAIMLSAVGGKSKVTVVKKPRSE